MGHEVGKVGWARAALGLVTGAAALALSAPAATAAPRVLRAGEVRTVPVAGQAGVPTQGVAAVLVNLTATDVTAATYVTAWPSASARPATSNLNPVPGRDGTNLAVVPVDASGAMSLYNHAGSVDLVVDLVGYIPTSSGFHTASTRLVDTRGGAPLGEGTPLRVPLGAGVDGVAIVNLTGVDASGATFLTAWSSGTAAPSTSNLNLSGAAATANLAVVQPGADGAISVANHAGRVDVVVDLLGWFPKDAGPVALAPTRVLDTRVDGSAVTPGAPRTIPSSVLRSTIGSSATGTLVATLTGVNATARSFATIWSGTGAPPATSNLNLREGDAVANLFVLPVDGGADAHVLINTGRTDLIVDVVAWIPGAASLTAVAPTRLFDSRSTDAGGALPPVTRTFTYAVARKGTFTSSDMKQFADSAAATLADGRGWRAAGIAFREVASGGDFTLWLSDAALVAGFGPPCTVNYSCRVGQNVIINELRWRTSSPVWVGAGRTVDQYQDLVVNHEVGHFLGLDHTSCAGAGQPAAVMQQQSKGLDGCQANEWPLAGELASVAR